MVRVSVVLVCLVTCMSISLTRGFVGEEVGEGPVAHLVSDSKK
jgi:hypothetical protein